MDWAGLLDALSRIVGVFIMSTGILALIFQRALGDWFRSRFAHAVGRELETYRHQLARELEAYKASALREMEEFKLGIDIRRSIALKMAGARLDALTTLAEALRLYASEAGTMLSISAAQRLANHAKYKTSFDNVRKAYRAADIFLPDELTLEIMKASSDFHDAVVQHSEANTQLATEAPEKLTLMKPAAAALVKIKKEIYAKPGVPEV